MSSCGDITTTASLRLSRTSRHILNLDCRFKDIRIPRATASSHPAGVSGYYIPFDNATCCLPPIGPPSRAIPGNDADRIIEIASGLISYPRRSCPVLHAARRLDNRANTLLNLLKNFL
jgi:hypothetical protein